MPLFKVEIIEERESFAFVRAATPAAAREIIARAAIEGEIDRDWFATDCGSYDTGSVEEIDEVPDGYEVDFGEDEEEEESLGSEVAEDIEDADEVEEP